MNLIKEKKVRSKTKLKLRNGENSSYGNRVDRHYFPSWYFGFLTKKIFFAISFEWLLFLGVAQHDG